MQTHELRYFLAVARTLNFTKAADRCGVSQPALTRAIKKLEGELGGALLSRRPGQVELTRLGPALLPQLEEIERRFAEVHQQAEALAEQQASVLRIGVMCTVGPAHVVDILSRLREKTPDLDVTIVDAKAEEVVKLLINDEIDVGLTAQPLIPDEIGQDVLFRERYLLALPQSHPLAEHAAVPFAMLEGVNYLERLSCEFDAHYEAMQRSWPFDFNVCYASEREDWIQALIASGQGCAIVPQSMVCIPGIVTRPLVEPDIWREVSLITLRGRELSVVAQSFVRLAKAHRWRQE